MLISQEENSRLERLIVERAEDQDVRWLCELAQRLAAKKPTEGEFPRYVALLNEHLSYAYALALAEKMPLGHGELLWNGTPGDSGLEIKKAVLYTVPLTCKVTDIFLCVRPCVRLLSPDTREARERLAGLGRVTVKVQERERGESKTLLGGPLSDFLVDQDGYGIHREPVTLRMPPEYVDGLFNSARIDESDMSAYAGNLGVFLASGAALSIEISYPIRQDEEIRLSGGFVMARYTSQEVNLRSVNVSKLKFEPKKDV